MTLRLFNTLTLEKEEFKPITEGTVRFYSCGPTVYNYAHIGNLRSFTFSDILKKYLKYKGYRVIHVMNITDVDDKTIKNSQAKGQTLKEYTEFYTDEFFKDFHSLKIAKPDIIPKATGTIPEMVELIEKLMKKGIAYRSDDGSIYFDISKFPEYGKLSHQKLENLKAGARVQQDEYEKGNLSDFALWKAWDEGDGEVFWETPIGKGRPGWHIECSAMSMKDLGETFDIHTGGIDLVFPHHENEIAQSEAATGKQFVHYWVHCEHLIVDGKKMSKSLGNFYTLRDLQEKGFDPHAVRYVLMSTHYRQQLNFTFESIDAAKASIARLNESMEIMSRVKNKTSSQEGSAAVASMRAGFEDSMDDNLNVSSALGAIFDGIKILNRLAGEGELGEKDAQAAIYEMKGFDSVLGFLEEKKEEALSPELQALIDRREEARNRKDWAESDRLRDELKTKGILLADGKGGVSWKRV